MHKLKAGVLPYVLIISLTGGILASLFILRYDLSLKEQDFYLSNYLSDQNSLSGINYGMANQAIPADGIWRKLDVSEFQNSETYVSKRDWGLFQIVSSKVINKYGNKSKSVLYGRSDLQKVPSLYITNSNQAITLSGNTQLEGICYLPELGIKGGFIEGQPFSNGELLIGEKNKSENSLPEIESLMKDRLEDLFSGKLRIFDSILPITSQFRDSICHSFQNRTIRLVSSSNLELDSVFISGNAIIECQGKIKIRKGCRLENLILIANEIEIDNKVSCFQAFAKNKITVQEESILKYPTVLCIGGKFIGDNNSNIKDISHGIFIEKKAKVAGVLLTLDQGKNQIPRTLISINDESLIFGHVYAHDMAEIKGEICGSLFCNKLYLKTNSAVYENHLLNAKISSKKLTKLFCGIQISGKNYQNIIIDEIP